MFDNLHKLQLSLDSKDFTNITEIFANEYDTLGIIENLRKHFHNSILFSLIEFSFLT